MSLETTSQKNRFFNLMHYTWTLLCIWTLVVSALIIKDFVDIKEFTYETALNTARAHLNKDKSFRFWGSIHGGVYVPVQHDTPPNPYLAGIRERNIITPSGRHLTLMNPEYMLRHLNDTFSELYGVASHITSLKPLRPENGPDEWETHALKAFEQGEDEIIEVITEKGAAPYLRLMQPLYVKPECLKCHGHQGYNLGDIRGGVGIKLPMNSFIKHAEGQLLVHIVSLLLLWVLGCASILIGSEKLRKSTAQLSLSNIDLHREVEERKRAEMALQKESSFTSAVLDTARALIMVLDGQGKIIRFNQACEQLSGYSGQEAQDQYYWELLLSKEEADTVRLAFQEIDTHSFPEKLENHLITKDKDRKIIDWSNTTAVSDNKVDYVICIGIDITEEKHLLGQLLHAEKLSAVGKLSASIAHEINNPLFGIRNVLDRLKEKGNLDADNLEFSELAIQECDRIKGLIKDLQDFNRPTSGIMTTMNLHKAIDNMLLLSKKEMETKKIQVQKNYTDGLQDIMAIADQIKQVLLNLFNNAMEAIGQEGTITITTSKTGKMAIIEIADTGSGMAPEVLTHIFEPFFSTKPGVKGTGLGLSVTYGIIKRHGGDITVQSTTDFGTTFTITLPIEGGHDGNETHSVG